MKLLVLLALFVSTPALATIDCRSVSARNEFRRQPGAPVDTSGYWVDHVCPLECGGLDNKINMQWQTIKDAMAKDRWERNKCAELCNSTNSTYPTRTVFNCKRGK